MGEFNQIKIGDFGAAKSLVGTTAITVVGTIPYMSPEMIKAETKTNITITKNSDIW